MIRVFDLPESEIELSAVRSSGPGGQHVNKVATAIHLRFDVHASSLPERIKQKLLERPDQRVTTDGVIVIKAQSSRSQEKNREEALARLDEMLKAAQRVRKKRKPTKPSKTAIKRRLDKKSRQGKVKKLRGKVDPSRD